MGAQKPKPLLLNRKLPAPGYIMKYNGKVLATVIRERRLQLNYSQDYVAGRLEMSQNAYSKMELGQTGITLGKFIVLCEALEIDMTDMLALYRQNLNRTLG